jgi:hypothetical protein
MYEEDWYQFKLYIGLSKISPDDSKSATSGAGIAYHSGAPEVTRPVYSGFRVTRSIVFMCNVFQIVVCPFVLFLLAIVLSVLLQFTDSDYSFGIFKLFLR